jgi:hypothetical protein
MPQTVVTFNGLLVFRRDRANDRYEVGVLRARGHNHFLQMRISPDPQDPAHSKVFDPDVLESHVQDGNVQWFLDVELQGTLDRGIVVNTGIPPDRKDLNTTNKEDFGWIVNVESGEFHHGQLARAARQLQPVIYLAKGRLFTPCLTDSVDITRGGSPSQPNAGFIAGAISLAINTSAGQEPVLYFVNNKGIRTELFRCINSAQRDYSIDIRNIPLSGPSGNHFHLYYELLFTGVRPPYRFDFGRHNPPVPPPFNRCPEDPVPDPFKCGGISINDGSGPLG